jgi:hypothetical protein
MISERQLSEHFHSFWESHLPLLSPGFMRRFNVEDRERLRTLEGFDIRPLPMGIDVRFDLVAEMAFEITAERNLNTEHPNIPAATERAVQRIRLLEKGREVLDPSSAESTEALALEENYRHFFDTVIKGAAVQFRPVIPGFGFLNEMEADFCTSDTLFEVKAVNRNLSSADLRQTICYLVAGVGSGKYKWRNYCLFNPRRAVYFPGNVNVLLSYLSGKSALDCIDEVLASLMEREQPLEPLL